MNCWITKLTGLLLLFSLCCCSEKKSRLRVGPEQRIFLPAIGFIKGPVTRIEETLDADGAGAFKIIYTLDHQMMILTKYTPETETKEVYYLDSSYRPDSMATENKNGRQVTVYWHEGVHHNMPLYHKYNNVVTDSIIYTVDSSNKKGRKISYNSPSDTGWHSTLYYNREGFIIRSVSFIRDSINVVTEEYEYDSNGNLKRTTHKGQSGGFIGESRIIKADEKGNWLEIKTTYYDRDGNQRSISGSRRKITYAR